MNRTLGIDIGTVTGWSQWDESGVVKSGSLVLATAEELEQQRREGKERTGDLRFQRLLSFLELAAVHGVNRIVFEDVEFVKTQMQGQLWGSLRAAIWAVAIRYPHLAVHCVSSVTLKHFATGTGCADKAAMAQALSQRAPDIYEVVGTDGVRKASGAIADHNEVDAIWLTYFAEAVDRGERSFVGAHQRKREQIAGRRQRKAERRLRAKAKKAHAKEKQKALNALLRSLGRCCGIYRVKRNRWAVCPRCGSSRPLTHPGGSTSATLNLCTPV